MQTMTFEDFHASLSAKEPPSGISVLLAAMWWEANGNWDRAHGIAQDIGTVEASWVHAYLHRKEGDDGNAGYWYRQAQRPHCRLGHDAEWEEIVRLLLAD